MTRIVPLRFPEAVNEYGSVARQCTNKMRHTSRKQARGVARLMSSTHGRTYSVYHCRWCDGWHLTTTKGAR